MRIVVADIEANGLLYDATKIWCGVFLDIKTKEKWKFKPHQINDMLKFMDTCDGMIMHNGINYDWPLLKKLYGYEYNGKKVDTLIMSRMQNTKRIRPFNMPREVKGGPHSLAAWGYRVGRGKPDHDEWDRYSKEMLHRCDEDVEITLLTYNELLYEVKGQDWKGAWGLTFKLFEILHKQEEYGWLVDRPYMDKSIKLLTHWVDKIDSIVTPLLPLIVEIQEGKEKGQVKHLKSIFLKSGEYSAYTKAWYDKNNLDVKEVRVSGPFSRVTFRPVDLNSVDETKAYLLSEGWIPEKWNYKKDEKGKYVKDEQGNRIKTSAKMSHDDPFEGINSGIGKLVAKRIQCRHRRSNIEGWIKHIREDGRISTPVSALAETGRCKHKVIVNVPGGDSFFGKQMRRCFVAKDGYKIVGTDSAGCQLRMLAARMGDDAYTHEILHGDMHTANQIAAGLKTRAQAKTFIYASKAHIKLGELLET
ncbi:MAG: putative DNA polymerase [Prokaryotic dsDNA virus sp.]|nr:MAG: putative DNA polymerase [Prokaryotic dsDNA virus sp.]|tara:strand:- start:23300 stop:24718 length:1419 start_codon:yes stop_codon:yes gene_type:complete